MSKSIDGRVKSYFRPAKRSRSFSKSVGNATFSGSGLVMSAIGGYKIRIRRVEMPNVLKLPDQ